MLIVIAIIGIIASLGILALGDYHASFMQAESQRNAQELVSVYTSAQSAGVDFTVPNDLDATLQAVVNGRVAQSGALAGKTFGLMGLSNDSLQRASAYIEFNAAGSLIYTQQPKGP